MEMELARIEEREEKIALSKAKKQADLQLLDDEEDDFKVKISLQDFDILKRAKLQQQANPAFVPQHPNLIGNVEDHQLVQGSQHFLV
jgi:glycine cleavage system pyridoxal-binding protein P